MLFGNSEELQSLYEVDTLGAAIDEVRRHCQVAAITAGKDGSYVGHEVRRHPCACRVCDARAGHDRRGDMYAAGFLFGYTRDWPLDECAQVGSIAASEVISHVGPRPLVELRTLRRDGRQRHGPRGGSRRRRRG